MTYPYAVKMKKLVTGSMMPVLLLSFLPLLIGVQPASACGAAPLEPRLKVVWEATGGPKFVISSAQDGFAPTRISYAFALLKVGKTRYENWSAWIPTSVSVGFPPITFIPPTEPSNKRINVSVYSSNNCGNSKSSSIAVDFVTAESLIAAPLEIAEDVPLALGTIPAYYISPLELGIPQTVTSNSPLICTYDDDAEQLKLLSHGLCELRISQNNEKLQTPNPDVTHTLNVIPKPKVLPGQERDRPDEIQGFQIHVVYVIPKNAPSKNFLESGEIHNWLDLANAWMKRKIGKEFIFDTYEGAYDISTLASQYETKDLSIGNRSDGKESKISALDKLRSEFTKQNGSAMLGKNMFFIVDAKLSEDYCGLGSTPGNTALSTPGNIECWDPEYGYLGYKSKVNSAGKAIAHELIHNLGVGHPCEDASDLMYGEGCIDDDKSSESVIDKNQKLYVNASKAGANILEYKVWKDGQGKKYIPLKGLCYINQPCDVSEGNWSTVQGNLIVQEKVSSKWRNFQSFKIKRLSSNKFVYDANIVLKKKGNYIFREYIAPTKRYSAYIGKEFKVEVIY